ncbi:MAG: ATP-binding protein, partial [Chitinophagales bacterium]|nr:ATP-binding protein [Chitinophagales bacterium]
MSIKNHKSIWDSCLKVIKDNVNTQSYKTWFEPIEAVSLESDVLTIQVPSQFFYEWLEEHYVTLLRKTVKRELGSEARLEYRIVVENSSGSNSPFTINYPNYNTGNNKNPEVAAPFVMGNAIKNPFVIPGLKKVNIESGLNPNYNFDSFIEGDCNRLCRSAGFAVSQKPGGTAFNPLVIYGGVGLGKTHLAQSIGNEVKQNFPNKTVLYTNAERFTNQFIESLKNNSVNDFVHFYQLIDVLIIDDIHFFGNKAKT